LDLTKNGKTKADICWYPQCQHPSPKLKKEGCKLLLEIPIKSMRISASTAQFRCGCEGLRKGRLGEEQKIKTHKAQLEPQPALSYAQIEKVCSGEVLRSKS